MGNVLVLGGTRFFGKRLVKLLAESGEHDVTIATRGLNPVEFQPRVRHVSLNRQDEAALTELARSRQWDIVFDNICMTREDALSAARAFDGQVKRYIVTSSQSVYGFGKSPIVEEDFNPYTYDLSQGDAPDLSYAEGKRLTEAALFQKADFPVAAVRIPIVLGPDDYTRRLHFHVERVQAGKPIGFPDLDARLSFISSAEAADFLFQLGKSDVTGPIQASSSDPLTLRQLIAIVEQETGQSAILIQDAKPEDSSPFGVPASWVLDTSMAEGAGFSFKRVMDWLPELTKHIAAEKV
ncbi:NAD-dependent epimerase/dehydratase family protein [Paenibacillus pinihumi]|uniref:NAD-dependent epimerase/dehydratase family protein n=1 Tax=Paenibacillus pinihumi TaxID=669462 RepID=UPI00041566A7|nr:NAD-dependent epimerase/dehydratase family protein [Paenibacillus pinihumi]